MNILIGFLIVLEILISILLTLVILVQPSKGGGGLGGALGGGMGEQLFGARTGNVLTKATIVLATVFLVNTLGLAFLYSRQDPLRTAAPAGPEIEAVEGEMEATDLPPVDNEVPEEGTMEEVSEPGGTE
jgi:preprotein translocase subunit SecG